mmetsp:Transcript_31477/g.46995  ORF Transcript_31477/g.46995 Transcript_31477/m.46995 type:complete len:89 (-) Transcript_31477:110-376(-)
MGSDLDKGCTWLVWIGTKADDDDVGTKEEGEEDAVTFWRTQSTNRIRNTFILCGEAPQAKKCAMGLFFHSFSLSHLLALSRALLVIDL